MHPFYKEFVEHLEKADKEWCVDKVVSMLSKDEIDVATLYDEFLAPALRNMAPEPGVKGLAVWREHERTAIVRTVIECCYPFVMKEKRKVHGGAAGERVIIACPTEELHDMGARMVADLFTLCGFEVTFIGANTPLEDIIAGIVALRPRYFGLSVTNLYNLAAARRTVEKLRTLRKDQGLDFKIIVGGIAFERNAGLSAEIGADMHLRDLKDIRALREVR